VRLSVPRHALRSLVALVAALGVLGAVSFAAAPASAAPTSPTTLSGPPYPPELIVKTELRLKADLISRNLDGPPQLVFFGGSRCERFDPVFARRLLGLRSVNISISCAHPEAAWGYANWIYSHWPDARLRWVWGIQASTLYDRDLDPALLQDPRFYGYFPDDLLESQRTLLPGSVADMPRSYRFLRNRYSRLGLLLWNSYDVRRAAGYTLDQSLDDYIANMLHEAPGTARQASPRAGEYFEKTLALLNAHGTTPLIVLMPTHPRVLRVMQQHDMDGGREKLRAYLAGLGEKFDLVVVDFTRIQSFHGKPGWFYDGVHITLRNADRMITALKSKAGEYLQ
jgi:hypothetical protein